MLDCQSDITQSPNHDDIYMPTRIFAYILLHMPYYKSFFGVPSFNGCSLGKWTKVPSFDASQPRFNKSQVIWLPI